MDTTTGSKDIPPPSDEILPEDKSKVEKKIFNTECLICKETFDEPITFECGHKCCGKCIIISIMINKKTICPSCRRPLFTIDKPEGAHEEPEEPDDAIQIDRIMSLVNLARFIQHNSIPRRGAMLPLMPPSDYAGDDELRQLGLLYDNQPP
jgi:hypothetical protein